MAVGHQGASVREQKIEFTPAGDGTGKAIQRIEPGLMIVGGVGSGDPGQYLAEGVLRIRLAHRMARRIGRRFDNVGYQAMVGEYPFTAAAGVDERMGVFQTGYGWMPCLADMGDHQV